MDLQPNLRLYLYNKSELLCEKGIKVDKICYKRILDELYQVEAPMISQDTDFAGNHEMKKASELKKQIED